MCLAIPACIITIDDDGINGVVDVGGVRKAISLALLSQPSVGDYVLLHVGYAIAFIDEAEALRTLALFEQAEMLGGSEGG